MVNGNAALEVPAVVEEKQAPTPPASGTFSIREEERDNNQTVVVEMDAILPLPLSPKWVAYACRMAGLAKPRWSRERGVWTTSCVGELVTIKKSVNNSSSSSSMHVRVEWDSSGEDTPTSTATARRLIATFITGMQWSLRQQSQTRMSLTQNRR